MSTLPGKRSQPSQRRLQVLVAEDNQVNQLVATRIFEKLGHQATVVSNGREAFVAFQAGKFDLIAMDEAAWDEFSRASAIRRGKRAGFLRNVAVALGNWGSAEAVPALVRALEDPEPLVRGHAAWALGRIRTAESRAALQVRAEVERDPWVCAELEAALGG